MPRSDICLLTALRGSVLFALQLRLASDAAGLLHFAVACRGRTTFSLWKVTPKKPAAVAAPTDGGSWSSLHGTPPTVPKPFSDCEGPYIRAFKILQHASSAFRLGLNTAVAAGFSAQGMGPQRSTSTCAASCSIRFCANSHPASHHVDFRGCASAEWQACLCRS